MSGSSLPHSSAPPATPTAPQVSAPAPREAVSNDIRRYPNLSRGLHQSTTRTAYRERTKKRDTPKLTPAEVAAKAQRREEVKRQHETALEAAFKKVWEVAEGLAADLGDHNPKYYYQLLMQQSKMADSSRGVNLWNAYVSGETKRLNEERAQNGETKERAGNYAPTLSEKWKTMTLEEKLEYTKNDVEKLAERRENQKYAVHNVSINCFHDSRASLEKIEREARALHERTGMHIFMGSVRGDQSDYMAPHTFSTDEKIDDYFQMSFGMEFGRYVGKVESFVLSGVSGAKKNAIQDLMEMKRKVSEHILDCLREAARPYVVNKMNYESFHTAITQKFGLIIENWPLPMFQAPGKFNSMAELKTLYYAWKTGHTRFRRLTREELERREQENMPPEEAPPLLNVSDLTAPPDPVTAGTARPHEYAFPAEADAPTRPAKKARKDKGTARGPNIRTRRRQEAAAAAAAAAGTA